MRIDPHAPVNTPGPVLGLIFLLLAGCGGATTTEPTTFATEPTTLATEPTTLATEPTTTPLPAVESGWAALDVQGHRGARGLKPENTLPAFETALDLGVTTLELDLHLTADGVPVIWHDPGIGKEKCRRDPAATVAAPDPDSVVPGGDSLQISRLTLTQVQTYLCDRNPDASAYPDQDNAPTALAGANYHIISLAQLFDFVTAYAVAPGKSAAQRAGAEAVQFNAETKRRPQMPETIGDGFDGVNPGPFELAILELVDARGLTPRVVIQSFDHRSLWVIASVNEAIRLAALTSDAAQPAAYAAAGAAIWSPSYTSLTPTLLAEAHEAGLLVIPWTVNDPAVMRELLTLGVDGIISDRPDLVLGRP